ncbi:complement C1q-like protein 3 [Saccostrea cucullata]|uniref:complement C1q-like protein 3 n=1 Tax=Saccostrea cuccullata TaxID=36930 RepID=UPI002ED1E64A
MAFNVEFLLILCMMTFAQSKSIEDEENNAFLLKIIEKHERMIARLEEKIDKQDRRIFELEKNCAPHSLKLSKTFREDSKSSSQSAILINESGKEGSLKNSFLRSVSQRNKSKSIKTLEGKKERPRRLLLGSTTAPSVEDSGAVGFYAYLGAHDSTPAANKMIKFDSIKVNVGNAYNPFSGVFTIPEAGVYVFSWTIECDGGGSIFTQIVKNNEFFGSIASDSTQESEYRMSTGVALTLANKGDIVFVRVNYVHGSRIHSSNEARSSFSGWKLN